MNRAKGIKKIKYEAEKWVTSSKQTPHINEYPQIKMIVLSIMWTKKDIQYHLLHNSNTLVICIDSYLLKNPVKTEKETATSAHLSTVFFHHGSQPAMQPAVLGWINSTATVSQACLILKQLTYLCFSTYCFFLTIQNGGMQCVCMLNSCVSSWRAGLPPFFPLWECIRPVSGTAASHLNCSDCRITHLLLQDHTG